MKKFLVPFFVYVCLFVFNSQVFAVSYFNGGWKTVSNNGAAATIETQNPSETVGCSAWSMTCSSTDSSYAQVGYRKVSGYTSPKYFYEYSYSPTSTWYREELGTASTGSNNNFKVGCDSSTMYFIINNTSYGTASLSTIPFTRGVIEISAETHDTADRCPGTTTNPVSMGSAQYKNTSNTWVSATCTNMGDLGLGYGDLSTMRNNISSSGSINWEVWDSR